MKYALTRLEMYLCDQKTIKEFGLSSQVLMENAGKGCADFIFVHFPPVSNDKVLIICGSGNNGGDGFVIARWLWQYGYEVEIEFIGEKSKMSRETKVNFNLCKKIGIPIFFGGRSQVSGGRGDLSPSGRSNSCGYQPPNIIIDALYGIGYNPQKSLENNLQHPFYQINHTNAIKIAIDIPSGLDADSGSADLDTFRADYTLTMAQPKLGHLINQGALFVGELHVIDIGIPDHIYREVSPVVKYFDDSNLTFPKRYKNSHKGDYGRLGIIAGSPGLTGAAILSSKAALNSGAGLITLYHQPGLENIFETTLTEVMTQSLDLVDQAYMLDNQITSILNNDTLLIGPGLGKSDWALNILDQALSNYEKPMVIDADAINLISENENLLNKITGKQIIITPHLGEFSRLVNAPVALIAKDPVKYLKDFCEKYKVNVLLKSNYCLSANHEHIYIITGGNDGLATGGSGDVLAGIISSFLVQNSKSFILEDLLFKSVNTATKYLYKLSQQLAKNYLTPAITPEKLINNIFKGR